MRAVAGRPKTELGDNTWTLVLATQDCTTSADSADITANRIGHKPLRGCRRLRNNISSRGFFAILASNLRGGEQIFDQSPASTPVDSGSI